MCGFVIGAHLAILADVEMEGGYRKLCEAAIAEGHEPPSRESYFGRPLKRKEPEAIMKGPSFKSSDWWPLWFVAIFG